MIAPASIANVLNGLPQPEELVPQVADGLGPIVGRFCNTHIQENWVRILGGRSGWLVRAKSPPLE